MKRAFSLAALSCVLALAAAAAGIDGKWVAKMELKGGKKGPMTVEFTLDLKSDGDKLTGSVSGGPGRRAASMAVENGKIEGNKFSFTTVQRGRKGDQKWQWEGTVSGDELRGTRSPKGRRKGAEFTAKRAS